MLFLPHFYIHFAPFCILTYKKIRLNTLFSKTLCLNLCLKHTKSRPLTGRLFSMYQFANAQCNGDAERDERRQGERPKRHISGRIGQMPRVARDEEQEPTRPRRTGEDEVHPAEDEPVAPIFQHGSEPTHKAQGILKQFRQVRQRRRCPFPQRFHIDPSPFCFHNAR